ncbi:MAG: hypothetical protein ACRC5H_01265 [Treponemataceae bacterium]
MKNSLKIGLLALFLLGFVSFFMACNNTTQTDDVIPFNVIGTWNGENDTGKFRFVFKENDFEYGGINPNNGEFIAFFKGSYTIIDERVLLTIKEYFFNYEEWKSFKTSPQQTITVVNNTIEITEGITIEMEGDKNFIYRATYIRE